MMKKKWFVMLALVLVLAVSFGAVAAAAQQTPPQRRLFDEDGNEVYGGSVYYDEDRVPVFGPGCWYMTANGARMNARGMDAFMYDEDGNLIPAPYGAWCRGWNGGANGGANGGWGRGRCRWR